MSSRNSVLKNFVENCFYFSTYTQYGFHNIFITYPRVEKLSTLSPGVFLFIFKDFLIFGRRLPQS